jgi:uncharacterized protein
MTAVLFVHGGGHNAFGFDLEIERRLQDAIGTDVSIEYPRFVGLERIEWALTFAELSARFASLRHEATVVAHSVGGAAALKVLSGAGNFPIRNLFLLAPPYKAKDSHWGKDDFTFSNDFAECLDVNLRVTIYHSRDDDTIPVDDVLLYRQKLPTAQVHLLDGYGHQFCGPLDFLANDIRSTFRS